MEPSSEFPKEGIFEGFDKVKNVRKAGKATAVAVIALEALSQIGVDWSWGDESNQVVARVMVYGVIFAIAAGSNVAKFVKDKWFS